MTLDQELVATKQQPASAKSAQDSLMCDELVKKRNTVLAKATTSGNDDTTNAVCARPYNVSEFSSRSTFHVEGTVSNIVPTIDPFSHKDAYSKKMTVLNPGSRMSSLNTVKGGIISPIDDNESLSMLSHRGRMCQQPNKALNQGSSALALSLYDIKFKYRNAI
jgi:hypothetical protein